MIIGVDIGGTKTAVAGFPRAGARGERLTEVSTIPTPSRAGGDAIVAAVVRTMRAVGGSAIEAIGVGTAGVVDADGAIASATDAITGWVGFPLQARLEEAIGVPVRVVNDVHAAAVAEAAVGAGREGGSVLMAAVGTGIGGAVVLPDGLRRGESGTAGSIGHLEISLPPELAVRRCPCGGVGHLEAVASGPGLERTYAERSGAFLPLRDVVTAASRGDRLAATVIRDGARYLGRALAGANALLDADILVVGGGVAQIGDSYLSEVRSSYLAAAMPGPAAARIEPAHLGIDAAITGAALLAPSR